MASIPGNDFALTVAGRSRLRHEPPHRTLGFREGRGRGRISWWTASALDGTVYNAEKLSTYSELDRILRNLKEGGMGIDGALGLLTEIVKRMR